MTRRKRNKSRTPCEGPGSARAAGGIPDRSEEIAIWKYLLLGAVFAVWLAFLIYCWLAGGLER